VRAPGARAHSRKAIDSARPQKEGTGILHPGLIEGRSPRKASSSGRLRRGGGPAVWPGVEHCAGSRDRAEGWNWTTASDPALRPPPAGVGGSPRRGKSRSQTVASCHPSAPPMRQRRSASSQSLRRVRTRRECCAVAQAPTVDGQIVRVVATRLLTAGSSGERSSGLARGQTSSGPRR